MLLSGCAAQQAAEHQKAISDSIAACLSAYPRSTKGLALKRNECLVEAENKLVRPTYPFPDLIDLRQAYQLAYARKVDSSEITPEEVRLRIAELNTKLTSIFEERRNARIYADSRAAESQAASTNALLSGLALLQPSNRPVLNTSCQRVGFTTNCLTY